MRKKAVAATAATTTIINEGTRKQENNLNVQLIVEKRRVQRIDSEWANERASESKQANERTNGGWKKIRMWKISNKMTEKCV